jgi:hypothetical protein
MIQPGQSNTGRVWLRDATKVRNFLPIPHTNVVVTYNRKGRYARSFNLKDFFLDVDAGHAGEGAYVSCNIA